jgi:hypothetical protein
VLTGNGLKDPDTAVRGLPSPTTVEGGAAAIAAALDLR